MENRYRTCSKPRLGSDARVLVRTPVASIAARSAALLPPLIALASGCTGGRLGVRVTMPPPGGAITEPGGILTIKPGLTNTEDGGAVCNRLRFYVYAPSSAPPAPDFVPRNMTPLMTGGALGTYNAKTHECAAISLGMPPRDNYWVVFEYPAAYYFDKPTVTGYRLSAGLYPVKIVDRQETDSSVTLKVTTVAVPGQ